MPWVREQIAGRSYQDGPADATPLTAKSPVGSAVLFDGRDWHVISRGWEGKRLPVGGPCDAAELWHRGRSEVAMWDFRFGEWYDPIRDDPDKKDPSHDERHGKPRVI